MEQGKHLLFYRQQQRGDVVVSRILHQSMLPGKQAVRLSPLVYCSMV